MSKNFSSKGVQEARPSYSRWVNVAKRHSGHLSRARLVGALVGGVGGALVGGILLESNVQQANGWLLLVATITYGAVIVYLGMPLITRQAERLTAYFAMSPPQQIALTGMGIASGLGLATLAGTQLSALPNGTAVTFAGAVVLALLGGRLGNSWGQQVTVNGDERRKSQVWLSILDSSVAIDDRLADLARVGILGEALVVTTAVTKELQRLGDSGDPAKVLKGRKGLDALSRLRNEPGVTVIFRETANAINEVDDLLLKLAHEMKAPLVTTDFTLTQRAHAEGVRVINVNEVAIALRPKLLPGEEFLLTIAKRGSSADQGVGYLEDGTMVVVNDGAAQVGTQARVTVVSVLQQASGRMVFARLNAVKAKNAR